jgi:hypothetical protein
MNHPATRGHGEASLRPQSSMLDGMRSFIRSTYLRATLAGLDMADHVLLLVDTSTKLGHLLASQGPNGPHNPGDDEILLFLASREAFSDALTRLGIEPSQGCEALSDPVELGAVRLVCVGEDIGCFEVVAAEGVC